MVRDYFLFFIALPSMFICFEITNPAMKQCQHECRLNFA